MTVTLGAEVEGIEPLLRDLHKLQPAQAREFVKKSLLQCGHAIAENARMKQIIRGGTKEAKGPRGGLRLVQKAAHPTRLTSRTDTLRDSIGVSMGSGYVDVGTHLKYGRAHELGFRGTVGVKAHRRRITQAWGRAIEAKLVRVKAHTRKMNLPRRPFLEPALKATERRFPQIFLKNWRRVVR